MTDSKTISSLNFDFGVARVLVAQDPKDAVMPSDASRLPPAVAISGPALNSIFAARNIDALMSEQIASGLAKNPVLQPLLFMAELEVAHGAVREAVDDFDGPENADRLTKLNRMLKQLCEHKGLCDQLRGNIAMLLPG